MQLKDIMSVQPGFQSETYPIDRMFAYAYTKL